MKKMRNVTKISLMISLTGFAAVGCSKPEVSRENQSIPSTEDGSTNVGGLTKDAIITQKIPTGGRYVMTAIEVSPVGRGAVPIVLLDLSGDNEYPMEVEWKVEPVQGGYKVYSNLKWLNTTRVQTFDFWRVYSTGPIDLHEAEILELDNNVTKYVFGEGFDSGQRNSLVMYTAPDLESLHSSVDISSSVPMWNWQMSDLENLLRNENR